MNHVHILYCGFNGFIAHHLAYGCQPGFLFGFLHVAQAFFLKALEGVGRGPGLVGAAAEYGGAGGLHRMGDGHELLLGFHGAGTCHDGQVVRADYRGADLDDGRFGMEFFIGQLVGFRYGDDSVHILEADEVFGGQTAFVADNADDGYLCALGKMGVQPASLNIFLDCRDTGLGGLGFHYNNHGTASFL